MADSIYRTPVVLSTDGLNHKPLGSGEKLDPNTIPIDTSILKPGEDGNLTISPDDLISKEPNNPLVTSPSDGKLKVDTSKLVSPNDPLLSVADNKIKSTLTAELNSAGQLVLKGAGGKTVATVTLPVIPGLPTVAEFLTDFTPPSGASVLGGSGKGSYLHLRFAMSNGTTKDLYISTSAFLNGAGGGDGGGVSVKPGGGVGTDNGQLVVNPGDIIVPGGGLVSDSTNGGKLRVNCADLKTCINNTVKDNFATGGGLIAGTDGKFKVDWTKAPSSGDGSSGGGGEATTSKGLSLGTKIGEYTSGTEPMTSNSIEWVLTDVKKDKILFIKVTNYEFLKPTSGGNTDLVYCRLKRPFVTYHNHISFDTTECGYGSNVDMLYGVNLGLENYVDLGPTVGEHVDESENTGISTTSTCPRIHSMVGNIFMFAPDKDYDTLTLSLRGMNVRVGLEAYQ
ncbi:MAG: hypothetical protein HDQ88_12015 [Clostridia bacterium]|nr:hypothetical protein [Clostridia bacterium]